MSDKIKVIALAVLFAIVFLVQFPMILNDWGSIPFYLTLFGSVGILLVMGIPFDFEGIYRMFALCLAIPFLDLGIYLVARLILVFLNVVPTI